MRAEQLLSDLVQRSVAVTVEGEELVVDAPGGLLTEELRRTLSHHKPQLVALVRGRSAEVGAMRLDEFASAGLIVEVRSDVLDADLLFVSDNVPRSQLDGHPVVVYRARELKKLARVPPDPQHLRDVHMVKEIFGGTIRDVRERPGPGLARD